VGLLLSRMAEGGDPRKGPHSVGLRLQDTLRVGPLKVEAVAAQVGSWRVGVQGLGSWGHSRVLGYTCWVQGCRVWEAKVIESGVDVRI
jgi:hypothetical protein